MVPQKLSICGKRGQFRATSTTFKFVGNAILKIFCFKKGFKPRICQGFTFLSLAQKKALFDEKSGFSILKRAKLSCRYKMKAVGLANIFHWKKKFFKSVAIEASYVIFSVVKSLTKIDSKISTCATSRGKKGGKGVPNFKKNGCSPPRNPQRYHLDWKNSNRKNFPKFCQYS